MLYAEVQDKKIVRYPLSDSDVRRSLTNMSLPRDISLVDLTEQGFYQVEATKPPEAESLSRIILDTPKWVDGKLVRTFKQEKFSDAEINNIWLKVKTERNRRLLTSDWTQGIDSPLSDQLRTEWADYRAKLRDLFVDATDPSKINWPKRPS